MAANCAAFSTFGSSPAPEMSAGYDVTANQGRLRERIVLIHPAKNACILNTCRGLFLVLAAVNLFGGYAWSEEPQRDNPIPPSPRSIPATASSKLGSNTDKHWQDRPLTSLHASIKHPKGDLPANSAGPILASFGVFFDSIDDDRPWLVANDFEWDAPATRNLPLFFEEPNLERLGYTYRWYCDPLGYESGPYVGEVVQPVVSAVHFFGRIPFVPYICGVEPPLAPIYTLGVDRPGSPVVSREQLIPISLRGAIYQVGAVCGLVFSIP
ncbi:hypothetical protein [Schlesneria paludicola]|uniref:hypothetical protein n=1 Tax=Schlesneria paludicola TaxID=360056 RepID=UPI00029ABE1E|nr:hypothetical protein [Schlesneria paludicola]